MSEIWEREPTVDQGNTSDGWSIYAYAVQNGKARYVGWVQNEVDANVIVTAVNQQLNTTSATKYTCEELVDIIEKFCTTKDEYGGGYIRISKRDSNDAINSLIKAGALQVKE